MKIAFFMQGLAGDSSVPHVSTVMEQVFGSLRKAGAEVNLLVAESRAWDLAHIEPNHDLYVLKSKSPLTLSLATILREKGADIVNSVESCRLARDKIAAAVALVTRNLPVPATWTTGQGRLLRPLINDGALWLKARSGSKGRGVTRVIDAADAAFAENPTDHYGLPQPLFAQRDVPSAGLDTKVYVVGERQWAITRPWPTHTAQDKQGQHASMDAELRAAAFACGEALGLEIYGVDFLIAGRKRHVVDINAFPGFKGVGEAAGEIASYLLRRLTVAAVRAA